MVKLIHDPQFMFRDAELERILTQLKQNKSVLLTGIRRTHQQVIPHIRRAFLHQFEERLAKHYNDDETDIAELVLDVLAKGDEQGSKINGSEMPRGYRQVLVKLQFDNFIIDGPDFTLCFSLKLLRQWWCASRGIA